MSLKVIDFDRKGNVIRFYLGKKTAAWGWTNPDYKDPYDGKRPEWVKPSDTFYGDDWDDAPYQDNAGQVYDQFIYGWYDMYVPFDLEVIDGWQYIQRLIGNGVFYTRYASHMSKNALVERQAPIIAICDKDGDKILREFYMGDELEDLTLADFKGDLHIIGQKGE